LGSIGSIGSIGEKVLTENPMYKSGPDLTVSNRSLRTPLS